MNDTIKYVLRRIVLLITAIGSIYLILWLGLRGMVGVGIGMLSMAYFILSDNPIIYFMLKKGNINGESLIKNEIKEERKHKVKFKR